MSQKERTSMIIFSGTADKLMSVGIIASGAVAMGQEVQLFLTMWGILALKKGNNKNLPIAKEFEHMGPAMMQIMQEKKIPNWLDTLKTAKELGDVKVFACGMTMDMFGLTKEDLDDVVDGVAGVGEFVDYAKEGKITLYI